MPLFRKGSKFQMYTELLKRDMVVPFIKMNSNISSFTGNSIYKDCVNLCRKCIKDRTEPKNSFMIFAQVFGQHTTYKEDTDAIWEDMWRLYDGDSNSDQVSDFIKKVLGTILMIEVAEDSGIWEWEPDPEKNFKLHSGIKPDAAIYNLRKRRD